MHPNFFSSLCSFSIFHFSSHFFFFFLFVCLFVLVLCFFVFFWFFFVLVSVVSVVPSFLPKEHQDFFFFYQRIPLPNHQFSEKEIFTGKDTTHKEGGGKKKKKNDFQGS